MSESLKHEATEPAFINDIARRKDEEDDFVASLGMWG
jgi:hypothetical protein